MRDAVGGGWSRAPLAERLDQANLVGGRRPPNISDEAMRSRLAATSNYTVVLLRSTDRLRRPAMDPIVWEHGRRNMALAEAGLLSIVLPVTDDTNLAGIGVFATTSKDTHAILQDDPGIRAGIFTYEIHPVRGFPERRSRSSRAPTL